MNPMSIFWLVAAVALGAVEAITVGLVSIWFAAGALAAMVVALFGGVLWQQVLAFAIVSLVCVVALRPLTKTKIGGRDKVATNADRIIGQEAVVREAIDNTLGKGAVAVSGVEWTARSEDGTPIDAGRRVVVLRIEGVKVFVRPVSA